MISCDTNILFAAYNASSPVHASAYRFLREHSASPEFVLCEQVLMEFYCLLRKPALKQALSAEDAVHVVQTYRTNPAWRIVDGTTHQREGMNMIWRKAAERNFAFRRIFDLRLAQTLISNGVDAFATRKLKDFSDCGFKRVFDPCL